MPTNAPVARETRGGDDRSLGVRLLLTGPVLLLLTVAGLWALRHWIGGRDDVGPAAALPDVYLLLALAPAAILIVLGGVLLLFERAWRRVGARSGGDSPEV